MAEGNYLKPEDIKGIFDKKGGAVRSVKTKPEVKKTARTVPTVTTYKSGSTYNGTWKDGEKHGHGIYKWADGDIYDGDWKVNTCDGCG